ncbi:MAG: FG-GAP repeat domain-containing protein [Candidatus Thorarchaeota archaeon]
MSRIVVRSLLIALSFFALIFALPLKFVGNTDQATFVSQAQDDETHMVVNDTWLSNLDLFSAWGEPRFALPSAPVYNVGTGVITDEGEEEIVVCNEEGFISSYRIQTQDRVLWSRELREGTPGGEDIIGFVIEDFTGDNLDDLIVMEGIISPIAGALRFHENLGNGSFAFPGIQLAGGAFPAAAGDFNGDGEMDLFGLTFQSEGWILWNVSDATEGNLGEYWERVLVLDPHQSVNYRTISAGDIDNDDRDEVLVLSDFSLQEIYIYELLDNGSFVRKQNLGRIGHQTYSAFGDVDGDGWLDLVISDFASNVYYLPNLGNGTLTPIASGQWLAFAPKAGAVALMDIDQDTKDDLILIGQGYNEVMFFWTSYVPLAETKDSNGSGLGLIEAIGVVAIPIALLALGSKRQKNQLDH